MSTVVARSPSPSTVPSGGEVERVAKELVSRVVSGRYTPGVRLPSEVELAEELGCGRSTVREALGRLGSWGLVASRRGSGAHVLDWKVRGSLALLPAYLESGVDPAEVSELVGELLALRRLLARQAVRLAARHGRDGATQPARAALAELGRASDVGERTIAELELFRALVVASAMWPAVWLTNGFLDPMREVSLRFAPFAGEPPRDQVAVLTRVLDHVDAREPERAEREVEAYFARVDAALERRLRDVLGPSTTDGPSRSARRASANAPRIDDSKRTKRKPA